MWGVIRVLGGRLCYQVFGQNCEVILESDRQRPILLDQPHLVDPPGSIRMQVEFFTNRRPFRCYAGIGLPTPLKLPTAGE
ncbi:hypothetical protein [Sphingomonas sp. RT2P30]|uniref:hypothetical protein n=1 Tax=Parasphingomonas halimpatiens TaxID=3096162 RepID=UPI003FA6CE2A